MMDVDAPGRDLARVVTDDDACISDDEVKLNPLKRSNSAPMINVLVETSEYPASTVTDMIVSSSNTVGDLKPLERVRRFSTSSMALNSTPVKIPSRLVQIKREETMAQKDQEAAHEKEIQSTIQISQSMEDIFVDESLHQQQPVLSSVSSSISGPCPGPGPGLCPGPGPGPPLGPPPPIIDGKRPKSLGEPLHIHVSQYYPYASSPSPTRLANVGKQCFSPSLQQPVYRSGALTPSPSPSPTRKSFASPLSRRSLSPITLRPSPLGNPGTKRKMDLDGERMDTFCSPAKRFHPSCSPGGSTPDRGHLINHQLLHSISSSSCDACNSPDQRVPNVSSASSSASFFRPVRDSTESRGTDSETSDITETTDVSEPADMSHLSESATADSSILSSASTSSLSPLVQHTPPSSLVATSPPITTSSSSVLTQPMSTMSVSPVSIVSTVSSTPVSTMTVSQISGTNYFGCSKVTHV